MFFVGLVSKLKALQVSENPLIYPVRKIIMEGTKTIRSYLKEQYEKLCQTSNTADEQNVEESNDKRENENENEELLKVQNLSSSDDSVNVRPKFPKNRRKKGSRVDLGENLRRKISDPRALQPTLNVKRLSRESEKDRDSNYNEPVKITHQIRRNGATISLTSCLDSVGVRNMGRDVENGLKEGWLNQLRILLSDQEKILQQERYI